MTRLRSTAGSADRSPRSAGPAESDSVRTADRSRTGESRSPGNAGMCHRGLVAAPSAGGGEGGIRTHEVFRLCAFQERRHQPLGHLSAGEDTRHLKSTTQIPPTAAIRRYRRGVLLASNGSIVARRPGPLRVRVRAWAAPLLTGFLALALYGRTLLPGVASAAISSPPSRPPRRSASPSSSPAVSARGRRSPWLPP